MSHELAQHIQNEVASRLVPNGRDRYPALTSVAALRLLGALLGIIGLLGAMSLVIVAAMWMVLLTSRHVPMVGGRHRHRHWAMMQRQEGPGSLQARSGRY